MTSLSKPVKRKTNVEVRDGATKRKLIVTLYPAGYIGLRPERTRNEEHLPLDAAYDVAIKMRVAGERRDRDKQSN